MLWYWIEVQKSILTNMSTLILELKIAYLRFCEFQEFSSDHDNSFGLNFEGQHVDSRILTLFPALQALSYDNENRILDLKVDYTGNANFKHIPCLLMDLRSGTHLWPWINWRLTRPVSQNSQFYKSWYHCQNWPVDPQFIIIANFKVETNFLGLEYPYIRYFELSARENPPTSIWKRVETSRADSDQNQKVGD